jgi:choline-sulfatase
LRRLLAGKTRRHRDHVFVGYAHNDEAMVRDERWKFVYQRGKRKRDDGYDPGRSLPGTTLRLFDLKNDPNEMRNLAQDPANRKRVAHYTALLADHCRRTARQPERVPATDDPLEVLDYCVQPHDVVPARRADGK